MHRLAAALVLAAAGCTGGAGDGVVDVAYIEDDADLAAKGLRLGPAAQALRSATRQGLVRFGPGGEIVPGIAERWIVTDDGRSYIFRITEFDLEGGKRLNAAAVRDRLVRTRDALSGTSLGLDLAKIADIRAMTGRVIEIRLHSPMPDLLQLLAQPEMGIAIDGAPSGPMMATRNEEGLVLAALPPERRGLPAQPGWAEEVHPVAFRALGGRAATAGFADGRFDVVLGGTFADLPLATGGLLGRGALRPDPAIGLFGIDVTRPEGFLADAARREALAMAIDRDTLAEALGVDGWQAAVSIVPPGTPGPAGPAGEGAAATAAPPWAALSLDRRLAVAAGRVEAWRRAAGRAPSLSLALPPGPGADALFARLAGAFAQIGVRLTRAPAGVVADLTLRDRVARFAGARWYLNQFHCTVAPRLCNAEADALVARAVRTPDPAAEAALLAEAERRLAADTLYIPLGAPIRWSQIKSDVTGFGENPYAVHPLFALSRAPM